MNYPIDWTKDGEIKRLFAYQTRIGVAPKFGTRPIGYYQQDQDHAYTVIMEKARLHGITGSFKVKKIGENVAIYNKYRSCKNWQTIGYVNDIYRQAEQLYYRG
jgi:hypothetical protein